MNEILTKALESGLFAALFCVLFFYMLKDAKLRENKYISVIEELELRLKETTTALGLCKDIKNVCEENGRLGDEILSDTRKIMVEVKSLDSRAEAMRSDLEQLSSDKERL